MSGEEFFVNVDLDGTVSSAKDAVCAVQNYEPGTKLKLICDGKVLKEEGKKLSECGITATSFLVAFASKSKKKKKATPKPAATPTPTVATPTAPTAAPTPTPSTPSTTNTTTPAPTAPPSVAPPAPQQPPQQNAPPQPAVDAATLQQVVEISGTDESTARTALIAAFGNAERAIQYIFDPSSMPQVQPPQQQQQPPQSSPSTGGGGGGGGGLEQLRSSPMFPQLQRLIQANPSALPQVLSQISQANPQLFAIINANPDAFVAMLNEPIAPTPAPPQQMGGGGMSGGMPGGMPGMGGGGMPNIAQLSGLINSLPEAQLQALGQQLGMSVDQLRAMGQQMANMPPQQLQAMMQMMGGGMGGMGGGGMPQQGGAPPGSVQINLTEAQRNDVDSLVNMGLGSKSECIQIYLACDKDVNQAASILLGNQ